MRDPEHRPDEDADQDQEHRDPEDGPTGPEPLMAGIEPAIEPLLWGIGTTSCPKDVPRERPGTVDQSNLGCA
jgi:hypothetical protein